MFSGINGKMRVGILILGGVILLCRAFDEKKTDSGFEGYENNGFQTEEFDDICQTQCETGS